MKVMTTMILALSFALNALAADQKSDPKKEEMMKQWKEYSTPGEVHKLLSSQGGNWTYTSKMWETKNGKLEESKGAAKMSMILGGRFLQQEMKGKAMGMDFQAMSFMGFDMAKQKYVTIWMDNMSTGISHGEGSFNKDSNTLSDTGSATCPMEEDKTTEYRGEWKIVDKNTSVYSMYGTEPNGKEEYLKLEVTYKRK